MSEVSSYLKNDYNLAEKHLESEDSWYGRSFKLMLGYLYCGNITPPNCSFSYSLERVQPFCSFPHQQTMAEALNTADTAEQQVLAEAPAQDPVPGSSYMDPSLNASAYSRAISGHITLLHTVKCCQGALMANLRPYSIAV